MLTYIGSLQITTMGQHWGPNPAFLVYFVLYWNWFSMFKLMCSFYYSEVCFVKWKFSLSFKLFVMKKILQKSCLVFSTNDIVPSFNNGTIIYLFGKDFNPPLPPHFIPSVCPDFLDWRRNVEVRRDGGTGGNTGCFSY